MPGVFRTVNRDDILFVGTSTSAGYFTTFGRPGARASSWAHPAPRTDWSGIPATPYLQATFLSGTCVLAENNSTAGDDSRCGSDEIRVSPGDRIPDSPAHSFKIGLS